MLKIGVLGAGHLGKIHIKCIQESNLLDLVGFYDPDAQAAAKAEAEYNTRCFPDIPSLIEACDIVDIVTPTISHFDCASQALKVFKHVFIEKPAAVDFLSVHANPTFRFSNT